MVDHVIFLGNRNQTLNFILVRQFSRGGCGGSILGDGLVNFFGAMVRALLDVLVLTRSKDFKLTRCHFLGVSLFNIKALLLDLLHMCVYIELPLRTRCKLKQVSITLLKNVAVLIFNLP
jgi:hypothetical protein